MVQKSSVVLLSILAGTSLFAKWKIPEVEKVPIERMVKTLEQKAAKNKRTPLHYYGLGRLYSMAYALKQSAYSGIKDRRLSRAGNIAWVPYFSPDSRRLPGGVNEAQSEKEKKQAEEYLSLSVEAFKKSLERNPRYYNSKLGLAWALDQQGAKQKAKKLYREVFSWSWEREKKLETGMGHHWSLAHETGEYLLALLDAQKEAAEIKTLKERMEKLKAVPRKVTPLLFPIHPADRLAQITDTKPRILFDLDGSGVKKRWPWPRKNAAWLVFQNNPQERIESALQMFGSVSFWIFWENGFEALGSLDENLDGKISKHELVGVSVWRDSNQDGISQVAELESAQSFGIESLALDYSSFNTEALVSPRGVRLNDGTTRPLYDWFVTSQRQ